MGLGATLGNLDKFLIYIDDFTYETTRAVNALDICFMSIYALAAEYDAESKFVWDLIQSALYKIPHNFEQRQNLDPKVSSFKDFLEASLAGSEREGRESSPDEELFN
jgi:hypothetical protein